IAGRRAGQRGIRCRWRTGRARDQVQGGPDGARADAFLARRHLMAYALYVTHPQVVQDPAVPVPRWGLSAKGRERAERFANHGLALPVRRIISSTETKALELAQCLAAASGAAIEAGDKFGENDRSSTGFVPRSEERRVGTER